jgi:hypothetical protein
MTGWAVNSIANAIKGSSPFLLSCIKSSNSSMVERNTVNILINVQFIFRANIW